MANVINLIQDLEKPENAARIAILGQTENVATLKQINIDFQSVYTTRFEGKYSHKQEGTSRQWRGKLTNEYDVLCQILTGLRLSATDPAEIAALDESIDIINSTTEQYTAIVNRRLGINASKKKDEGTETPAPGTPDNPQQQPDTTNPTAPDTPNQNPGTGPHPLDPNEHPSMGEH